MTTYQNTGPETINVSATGADGRTRRYVLAPQCTIDVTALEEAALDLAIAEHGWTLTKL